MATNRNVITNTFAQFGGKVGTVLASFLVVKIVSGYGAEFYGDYVTAYEFLAFFGVLADAGLFAIAVRDISRKTHKSDFIVGNILAMRLGLVTLAVIAAGVIYGYLLLVASNYLFAFYGRVLFLTLFFVAWYYFGLSAR